MSKRKENARPKTLRPGVLILIAQRAVANPDYDRELLANEIIKDIELAGEIPPSLETCKKYISEARSKYAVDSSWNTATLDVIPIQPEVIPYLITTQLRMKEYYSKPINVREAKWYNRLFGFKKILKVSHDIESNPEIKEYFLANVIAEWAHIYAYREKIDSIAKLKNPDYSDYDYYLVALDYKAIYDYGDKFLIDNVISFTSKPDSITEDGLSKWSNKIFIPSLFEQIRYIEARYLGHSLGEPDFNSFNLYAKILIKIGNNDTLYFDKIARLSYSDRIEFFTCLRKVCKECPEKVKNTNWTKILSELLGDGENERILKATKPK